MRFLFVNNRCHWLVGYLMLATVFIGSVVNSDMPAADYLPTGDKILHALAYAILAGWFAQIIPAGRYLNLGRALFAYGAVIELTQGLLPHRSASIGDLLANLTGITCALFICSYLNKWAEKS